MHKTFVLVSIILGSFSASFSSESSSEHDAVKRAYLKYTEKYNHLTDEQKEKLADLAKNAEAPKPYTTEFQKCLAELTPNQKDLLGRVDI